MRKSETYRNEIKSYIVRTGMTMTEGWTISLTSTEPQRSQSLRQTQAWFALLWRGGRVGGRAGVRYCVAKAKIRLLGLCPI